MIDCYIQCLLKTLQMTRDFCVVLCIIDFCSIGAIAGGELGRVVYWLLALQAAIIINCDLSASVSFVFLLGAYGGYPVNAIISFPPPLLKMIYWLKWWTDCPSPGLSLGYSNFRLPNGTSILVVICGV